MKVKHLILMAVSLLLVCTLFGCSKTEEAQNAQPTAETQQEVVEKDLFYFDIDKAVNPSVVRRKDRVTGLYTIRFLKDGQILEYQTAKENIPSQLDYLRAVTLELDAEGYIKKIHSAQSTLGGQFLDQVRVLSVNGNTLELEGISTPVTVVEDASVYDLSGRSVAIGEAGKVQVDDVISCYVNDEKLTTQVYILRRYEDHSADHICEHCNTAVEWTVWDGNAKLTSGHYCLTDDITLENAQVLKNAEVVLFLNGHHITSKQRLFELSNNASLSIVDQVGASGSYYGGMTGGGLKVKDTDAEKLVGGCFYVDKTSVLRIYGGNFNAKFPVDKSNYINRGGVVYTEGTFEFAGGVITGTDVGYSAGAVFVGANAVFKMSGGVLQYGSAYKQDKISGTGRGGTMVVHKEARSVEFTGGKLIAGVVDGYGGGIYTEHSITISNTELCGDYVDGTNQAEYGGILWVSGKDTVVDLKAGTVFRSGNSVEGGNIGVRLNCVLNVHEGAVIRNGYGSRNGGNVAVFGTLNIKGGQVIDGQSDGAGGNIFAYSNGNTIVNVESGTIANGTGARGGNICMSGTLNYENGSVLNVTGGEIVGGTATKYNGGNIAIRMHSVANITGGKITGGKTEQYGGGLSTEYTKDSDTSTQLNIGGTAYIFDNEGSDVYLAENTNICLILDEPLKDDAKIGVMAVDTTAAVIVNAYEKCLSSFVWTVDSASLVFEKDQVFAK